MAKEQINKDDNRRLTSRIFDQQFSKRLIITAPTLQPSIKDLRSLEQRLK